jgi:hypothetical protein
MICPFIKRIKCKFSFETGWKNLLNIGWRVITEQTEINLIAAYILQSRLYFCAIRPTSGLLRFIASMDQISINTPNSDCPNCRLYLKIDL